MYLSVHSGTRLFSRVWPNFMINLYERCETHTNRRSVLDVFRMSSYKFVPLHARYAMWKGRQRPRLSFISNGSLWALNE